MENNKKLASIKDITLHRDRSRRIRKIASDGGLVATLGAVAATALASIPFVGGALAAIGAVLSGFGYLKARKEEDALSFKLNDILDQLFDQYFDSLSIDERQDIFSIFAAMVDHNNETKAHLIPINVLSTKTGLTDNRLCKALDSLRNRSLILTENSEGTQQVAFFHVVVLEYIKERFSKKDSPGGGSTLRNK